MGLPARCYRQLRRLTAPAWWSCRGRHTTAGVAIGGSSVGVSNCSRGSTDSCDPGDRELPIVFGPVHAASGLEPGNYNVRPKTCSYSCVYCQLGATNHARTRREAFREPAAVAIAVRNRVGECRESGQAVDYATFVPDGEPTLDAKLGESIRAIRAPDLRVAVITNASLLWREDVRDELRRCRLGIAEGRHRRRADLGGG